MTTATLIGKETAKARLVVWHKNRIARAFPLMCAEGQKEKLDVATGLFYQSAKPKAIYKEYDEVFSQSDSKWTADDQSTLMAMGMQ